ncbi:PIR protein [Plasmodium malariae]|uniref:PIR protein n=1 Tax=Plasmodium malariae TaxID=5858 RepID=A0A1D3JLU0_PLAMA|nr:PIR protein [Plasmodium malariae]SBT87565.1 PIR protein [Plasmodium malariae]
MRPEVSKKVKVFSLFDEDHEPNDSNTSVLLSPLKKDHTNLYKIGCMLNNSIKIKDALYSLISDSISETEYCDLLNEWLDQKKNEYINEGTNCESNTKLWEEKIENLWIPLMKNAYDSVSCHRKKSTYNCFILPEMKTSLSVGFTLLGTFIITFFILYKFSPFGHWIHNCLRKKRKTIQNIVPEDSYKLINESSYMGKSHTESGKIRISYGSV